MDAPDRSSSTKRLIKRQRLLSKHSGDDTTADLHGLFRKPSGRESIEFKNTTGAASLLTTEAKRILRMGSSISRPALDLLDLFLCLWQCYVVKSAEKIRLEREGLQLWLSTDELKAENGLLTSYKLPWDRRKRPLGISSVYFASFEKKLAPRKFTSLKDSANVREIIDIPVPAI